MKCMKSLSNSKKQEIHTCKIASNSLEVALETLEKINVTMRNVGCFWEVIKALCKSMMTISMKIQVERLSDMESQQCKNICQNDVSFWKDTIMCYVKWFVQQHLQVSILQSK